MDQEYHSNRCRKCKKLAENLSETVNFLSDRFFAEVFCPKLKVFVLNVYQSNSNNNNNNNNSNNIKWKLDPGSSFYHSFIAEKDYFFLGKTFQPF